jgi:hypothetical protein
MGGYNMHLMNNRPAYLTVPGPSVTSVLLNIPYVLSLSSDPPPVILMDVHDYERLRAETVHDTGDNKKAPYLMMAFDDLRRRGFLRLIDYAAFYPAAVQEYYLEQNQQLRADTPDWVHRRIAMKGNDGWIGYGRGEYQEQFRASLGEDPAAFDDLRQAEQRLRRRMKHGTGDPVGWSEKVFSRGIAGLAVRRQADRVLDLDVRGVISGPKHQMLGEYLTATQSRTQAGLPIESTAVGCDVIATDASYLEQLDPVGRITGLTPSTVAYIRGVLDTVGEIAADVAGVQHDDWFVLGPTFALPQYNSLFNLDRIRMQIEHGVDADRLASEATAAVAALKESADQDLSPGKCRYEADWIAETTGTTASGSIQGNNLVEMVDYALTLSDYSRTLRTLTEDETISQAAAFVAASIMSDPVRRSTTDAVYRRGLELMTRFDPPAVDRHELTMVRKERRSDTWGDHTDWFEAVDRAR